VGKGLIIYPIVTQCIPTQSVYWPSNIINKTDNIYYIKEEEMDTNCVRILHLISIEHSGPSHNGPSHEWTTSL